MSFCDILQAKKTKTVPGDSGTVVLFLLFAVHQITNDVLSCNDSH